MPCELTRTPVLAVELGISERLLIGSLSRVRLFGVGIRVSAPEVNGSPSCGLDSLQVRMVANAVRRLSTSVCRLHFLLHTLTMSVPFPATWHLSGLMNNVLTNLPSPSWHCESWSCFGMGLLRTAVPPHTNTSQYTTLANSPRRPFDRGVFV